MTEIAPTDDVAACPLCGLVGCEHEMARRAELAAALDAEIKRRLAAPTDDVAALVALRKPGHHLSAYDEGWNDALDIAEQRVAVDYEASQGALTDVLTEHREMQERVLAIHKRILRRGYCQQCAVPYPCPTVDALGGPL